jgi:glycosyltransferase involved in cell wall biosynthesis
MTNPLVTVIICVYNAGEYLRPSLLSIIGQTYQNLEILMVDDGSTDGCFERVQDLLTDSRIRVFHQANSTKPVALNRALDHLSGEFYVVHDADDISYPRRIEKQLHMLVKHPRLAAAFCGNDVIINGRSMAPVCFEKSEIACRRDVAEFRMPALDPTGMYRMSLVGHLRYDPLLPLGEGLDYILRVGEKYPMVVLGDCLYGYRVLQNSLTRIDPTRRDDLVIEAIKRACHRRGMDHKQTLSADRAVNRRSKHSRSDNNIAAYFINSALSQRREGHHWAALKTGLECVRLHPLDLHYYKALIYAVTGPGVTKLAKYVYSRPDRS